MLTELLIMQPVDFCNLNCSYCYLPGRRDPKIMSQEVLDATFRCVFQSSMVKPLDDDDHLTIVWHSGEPLVAGIDFYKRAIDAVNQYNTKNVPIINQIQTNATLMDSKWGDFFQQNDIVITVSLDGPEFLHDKYRKNWNNHGSFKKVMAGLEYVKQMDMPLSAICVLTMDSLDHPEEIYQFFRSQGFKYLSLNLEENVSFNARFSSSLVDSSQQNILVDKYSSFMSTFYDLWNQDNRSMWIRDFNKFLGQIQYIKNSPTYSMKSSSALAFNMVSISKEGDISTFSPELAFGTLENPKQFVVGNVLDMNSLDEVIAQQTFQEQLSAIHAGVKKCSETCSYFSLCGGGQPVNKFFELGSFDGTETSYCALTKKVFTDVMLQKLST